VIDPHDRARSARAAAGAPKAPRRPRVGAFAAAGSATAFGVTIVVQRRLARDGLPVATALGIRFSVAAVVLLAYLAVRRAPLLPVPGERSRALLLGVVGYAGEAALFYAALQRGSAGAVSLLFYAYPAIVTLLEVALRLRPPRLVAFAVVALSTVGVVLVVVTGDRVSISAGGVAFSLAAATSFSCYLLLSQRLVPSSPPAVVGAHVALGAGVALVCVALVSGVGRLPAHDVPLLLVNGTATALAFALLYAALGHLAAGATAVVMTLEAFVAVGLAAAVLDETIRPLQLVGGLVVIAAAVVVALDSASTARKVAEQPV
jgi:drug/metabolite transporter (DMT)-like permease